MTQGKRKQEPVWTFRASNAVTDRANDAAEGLGINRSEFIRRAIQAAADRLAKKAA